MIAWSRFQVIFVIALASAGKGVVGRRFSPTRWIHGCQTAGRISSGRTILSNHVTSGIWKSPAHIEIQSRVYYGQHNGAGQLHPQLVCRGGAAAPALAQYFAGNRTRCWLVLLLAITIDTLATTIMKVAQEEASLSKLAMAYVGYFVSLFGFALSMNGLDMSIAYAVWAALGTAIVSVVGILIFNESYDMTKLACLGMIVLGVVGLNLREEH